MEVGDKVLILPKGREKDLNADEVMMPISQHELNERKITKGDLVLLGVDGYNISNQLYVVSGILTSKDFPKGTIADGQCIIHLDCIPNTIVQNGFTINNAIRKKGTIMEYINPWKEVVTAILIYDLECKKYRWLRNSWSDAIETYWADKDTANRVLNFFQCRINVDQFKDFTDKYGAIWFKDRNPKK